MKYPKGRRVIIAGDVLLQDGENPYDDGKFPFVATQCYKLPGKFWGMSEVDELITIQTEMCALYNSLIDNAKLNGNPWVIKDKNSGVDSNSLTNVPGLVVTKNPGSEVKREAPPAMPSYIQQVIQDLKYDVQVVSGVFDATRGERPASITSGVAIQALQDSSQGRIRLKTQQLENMLSELGSMWLSRMQQFWNVPRTIRIMGGKTKPNEIPLIIDGQPVQFKEVVRDEIDGDFDVIIQTGSTMPVNKSARLETVLQLAQTIAEDGMPVVDRRTIIEYCELDNAEDILRRFEEQAQKNAEEQAQQQQNQQELMLLQEQNDMANIQMNQKNQMEAKQLDIEAKKQEKQMDIEAKMQEKLLDITMQEKQASMQNQNPENGGEKTLQENDKNVESKVDKINLENMTIEELLQYVGTLSEEQLHQLVQAQPEITNVRTIKWTISTREPTRRYVTWNIY